MTTCPTTVVNLRSVPVDDSGEDIVYVGRRMTRSKRANRWDTHKGLFGNPYKPASQSHEDEQRSVESYREYFHDRVATDRGFLSAVRELRGKRLACWCAPAPCHAEVIAEWLNSHDDSYDPWPGSPGSSDPFV